MADINRILIVGGGIAGLSLATALQRQGLAAELIERNNEWPAVGAGIITQANGVRTLSALGIGDAINKASAVIRSWSFVDQDGRLLCETDLVDMWGDVGHCVGISRVRLQEALLLGASGVPHRLGVSLTALTQHPGSVSASFSDGTSGNYDLVVGADGIYSTVRELAVSPSTSPRYAGTTVRRSIVHMRPPGIVDNIVIVMGEGAFFGLAPIGNDHTYGFGAVGGEQFEDQLDGRLERFRRRFAGFGGPIPAYLAALQSDEQIHVGPIEWIELGEWYRGRVVLIGDAAHAGPPHMTEGGCMAMEDGLVLADVLHAEESVERALEVYARRRKPRTDWVQEQSRAAAQAWVQPTDVRNAALRKNGDQMFRERYKALLLPP